MSKIIKTISTVVAVTTATLIATPLTQGVTHKSLLANHNNNSQVQNSELDSQNNIYNNTINIENVWGQQLFNLGFNNENRITVQEGWSEVNPYSKGRLNLIIRNPQCKILKNFTFKGGDYPANQAYDSLDGFKFNVGDIITLSSDTGSEYFINNGEKQTGSVTYKITQNGLVQITAKATKISALYDGNNNVKVSCMLKPNENVYIENNGNEYQTTSNDKGLVNVDINGNVGDTISIISAGELQSNAKVTANKEVFILQGQKISVENLWSQPLYDIEFTYDNTFKIADSGYSTDPYYTGKDSMTVQLLSSDGNLISQTVIAGGASASTSMNKLLDGKSFKYGDIIHITSNSGAFIKVGKSNFKKNVYLKLTNKGIVSLSTNNKTYKASYDGTGTVVSGNTLANSSITITANGKEYKTVSDANGAFSVNLPNTVKADQTVNILNADGVTQSVVVKFNKATFGVLNSYLKVINGWGSDAINITFNPQTMEINTNGWNQFLGNHSGNPFIGFSLYNGQTGNVIKSVMYKGTDDTNVLANAINKLPFSFGDIVGVTFDSSQGHVQVCNNKSSIGNKTGSIEYFKITQNGLTPYSIGTKIAPLNILTSRPTSTVDVKGTTTPNTNVTINVNGNQFKGISNSNGDFSINITSKTIFTPTTAINVKVDGQVGQTVYCSASNMIESNSGVYIAGKGSYYGKIVFNPLTMKMNWFDSDSSVNPADNNPTTYKPTITPANLNTQIDANNTGEALGIKVTSPDGKVVLNKSFNGTQTIRDIYHTINNFDFQFGDIINVYHNPGSVQVNILSNGNVATPNQENVSFKVTPGGLVDAIKGQSHYSSAYKLSDYYAGNGIVSTGLTASGWDASSKLLANNMVMNQAMKDRVNQAIKGCTNDYEKAQAIFKIVSPVPYISVGGNTINTYYNGGVCFNKAQLYAVMCQYAGIVSRLVTGYANEPSNYQSYGGFHSWNQVWIPSQNKWVTVDTTWHIFNCNEYVNTTRHSFVVQATLWNPKQSYTSYFKNDPAMAWYHTGEIWNHVDYYNFNLGNDPAFRNLFKGVAPSEVNINNNRGSQIGSIIVGGENNTFDAYGQNSKVGSNISISLLDPTTGSVIFNDKVDANQTSNDLAKQFNAQHYKIGDILEVSYSNPQGQAKVNVVANNKTIKGSTHINQMYKITNDGLVPFSFDGVTKAKACVTTGLDNEAVYTATVTGTTIANKDVNVEVNGKTFTAKSNSKGEFTVNVDSTQGITAKTNIYVSVWGAKQDVINPIITNKLELADSSISINNVWYYDLGKIGFNTNDMKLTEVLGWYQTNPYLSKKDEAFSIGINDENGKSMASLTAMGSDPIPAKLKSEFNDKSFKYGDSITIDYKRSANIILNNVIIDGKFVKSYKVTGAITLYVTKSGLTNQKPTN